MMLFIPLTDNWMEKLDTKLIDTNFFIHSRSPSVFSSLLTSAEVFSEPCQTSKMERFAKMVNGF